MDPWFKFFASDYLLDENVDALPLEAQGILVRLWCLAWRDQLLKDDPDTLARRAMVDPKAMRKHWAGLRAFFRETPEGLVSDRMERERSESRCVSESRRLGARLTNEKRWGKRDGERVAGPSLTDRSAIAQRQVERVAQVSLSESESDTEQNPPTPPSGGQGAPKPVEPEAVKPRRTRRSRQQAEAEAFSAYRPETVALAKAVVADTPREDESGRVIRVDAALLAERLDGLLQANADLTPEILQRAWKAYVGGKPSKLKAPQYFFGRPSDQGDNAANWRPFARLVWSAARKPAPVPAAGPVLLEPAV